MQILITSLLRAAVGTVIIGIVIASAWMMAVHVFDWRAFYSEPLSEWKVMLFVFLGLATWEFWTRRVKALNRR